MREEESVWYVLQEWHVRWHYIYYPDSEKCCFSRVDDIPTSSGAGWKQPLFIFKEQALSLHSSNDNFDKVLLMWDGGCAMRTERQHWMGWAGLSTAEKGCRKVHSTFRLILGLYCTQRGLNWTCENAIQMRNAFLNPSRCARHRPNCFTWMQPTIQEEWERDRNWLSVRTVKGVWYRIMMYVWYLQYKVHTTRSSLLLVQPIVPLTPEALVFHLRSHVWKQTRSLSPTNLSSQPDSIILQV